MECYILAGGQSRRFGEDKTLFNIGGLPCVQRIVEEAKKVCRKVFLVAKETDKYKFLEGIVLIKDILESQSALIGLCTALNYTKQERIIILSADMPLIKSDLISLLWNRYNGKITLYEIMKKTYPLFGVYPKKVKKPLEDYLATGDVKVMDFVKSVGYDVIGEDEIIHMDHSLGAFINMNTKEDARLILKIYERDKPKNSGHDL